MRGKTRILVCIALVLGLLAACAAPAQSEQTPSAQPSVSISLAPSAQVSATPTPSETASGVPKYIFLFIGDGMSFAQIQAAQIYKGSVDGGIAPELLNFSYFPTVGLTTTYDTTSYIPDSAAAGTAIACGVKTETGTIGLAADGVTSVQSIAEMLQADGKKTGIVTSTSLNNATPASFYAHADSRGDYYDIAQQMAASGVDYFGGGGIYQPTGSEGDQTSAYTLMEENGYTVADTEEEIEALSGASGRTCAVSPVLQGSEMLPFAIDAQEGDLALADFVRKGIDVLDSGNGFFMMCEGGKIDPACHANDAATAIGEVLAFEDAIQEAVNFMGEHPAETLILVTADHETGGMALGYTLTQYDTSFEILQAQHSSYLAFTAVFEGMQTDNPDMKLADVLPVIREYFGLAASGDAEGGDSAAYVLTNEEYTKVKEAFAEAMKSSSNRDDSEEADLDYGSYNPLTVTLTHILDSKAGISWTTYYHTAALVPVYAAGVGAEQFSGSYDDTDIFSKLVQICGLNG